MPRKKLPKPETQPERRKRLIKELLDLPTADLIIVHEVIGVLAERREETISEAGGGQRAEFVNEETPGPRAASLRTRKPRVPAAAASVVGRARRRPRGYAAGTPTAPIQEDVAQVGDEAQPVGSLEDLN